MSLVFVNQLFVDTGQLLTSFLHIADANALYLWCTAQEMPCGLYIRRKAEDNFVKEYASPISSVATEWLANEEHRNNITIEHARNRGEFKVGARRIPVDGFHR